jgi:hypothetical protein
MSLTCEISINENTTNSIYNYELILPISLQEFNNLFENSSDHMTNENQFYFPPKPIIDILDSSALNAGAIEVQNHSDGILILCENKGHAEGFLAFYKNNIT